MSNSIPSSVPKSTNPLEEIVEEVETVVEHVFEPRPGGMVDTWHKEKARREAAQREAENAAEKVQEGAAYAVKVTQLQPEVTTVNIVTVPAGATAMLLPASPFRYRASISVVTTGKTALLSRDNGQALGGVGFPVVQGNPPFIVNSRAQLWAFNSDVNAIQVAVLSESYAVGK